MVNFLEGMDKNLLISVMEGPYIPQTLVPRVIGTSTTVEIPAYYMPKDEKNWDEDDIERVETDKKAKRLIIMALPNEIF